MSAFSFWSKDMTYLYPADILEMTGRQDYE